MVVEHGFPTKIISLIRAMLEESKPSVWMADEIMSSFVTIDELKQGDAPSTFLLNIALRRD